MQDDTDNTPLDKQATAKYLRCSVPQILNLVHRGDIPEGQTIGGRKKYWFKVHLDQYIAAQLQKATQSWSSKSGAPEKARVSKKPKSETQPKLSIVKRTQRDEIDVQDARRRQQQHIQESCQSESTSSEENHLRSILGDLSQLLKSRKNER